jgi:succinate dehydrogenase / fumarate reductase, membrane anchor subunit
MVHPDRIGGGDRADMDGGVTMNNPTAHSKGAALSHWVRLRFSSLLLVPLTVWLVISIVGLAGVDHDTFTTWLQSRLNAGLLGSFILLSCYHGALGLQEIIEDYISCELAASCAILAEKTAFLGLAVMCIGSIVLIVIAP